MTHVHDIAAGLPKHRNTVEFACMGEYGLFTDPIYKLGGEKFSLQVPTYEALKGILSSVYWKPTIIWVIDAVRIMKPIQTEVKGIRTVKMSGGNDLSYYTYLKDCLYQVRAHFIFNENRPDLAGDRNENKHHQIAKRMIEKGGRWDVFLGCRECQGYVEPCVFGDGSGFYDDVPRMDIGMQYHGITYADEAYAGLNGQGFSVRYAPVVMKYGIIEFPAPWECGLVRPVRQSGVKAFSPAKGNFTGVDVVFGEVSGCEPS